MPENANNNKSYTRSSESLYNYLEIDKSASKSEIKKAYHTKALTCHPDKYPNNQKKYQQFQNINKASNILRNTRTRRVYDKLGQKGLIIIEKADIEVAEAVARYDRWYHKLILSISILISGCCCCLCCCCVLQPPRMNGEDDYENSEKNFKKENSPKSTPFTVSLQNWIKYAAFEINNLSDD